ncbi:MAG: hypothetical protein ACE5HQ_02745 [Gemmatimonadota bacterium]
MGWRRSLTVASLVLVSVLTGPAVSTARAQGYFGRNKIQYQKFHFKVLKTEHFDIHYYDEEAEAAELAGRLAERWYARLSRLLNHEFRHRQPIILYANHTDFEQTNATPAQIDESTGGFTDVLKRRIVLPLAGSLSESSHVLGHEMVHAFQFDITGEGPGAVGLDIPGAVRLPLWFIEGMAEYLSLGPIHPFTAMWLRDAVRIDDFPTIPGLRNPKYFPYRFGHALWSYIGGTYGEDKIGRILRLASRSGSALAAIQSVLEVSIDDLSERWKQDVEAYYASLEETTHDPDFYGRKVIYEEATGGRVNLGPAISPDGSELIYLSERGLFAIDMYLADARTGKVKKRLTKRALDPHFESLQYINSAGSWSPDGRLFVFSGVNQGKPVVSIMDVHRGRIVREVKLKELGEIYAPTMSPDARKVAFSASVGGVLDLFVLDLDTEQLRRLTDDPYADFQPSWSPDGKTLAFVTDRFDASLSTLKFGPYKLASVDLGSGRITRLPSFDDGRNIDPHFSPDGRSLYFVSDHAGISNLYRLDLASGERYQVTNLWTGVSGLTDLSPSLSIAAETGDVAFSANRGGPFSFEIYVIDAAKKDVLTGRPAPQDLANIDPAVIPPRERASLEIVRLLENSRLGLADTLTFQKAEYHPGLSLDFISQPTLAAGASDFGVFFAGGASLFFSDLLGNRSLSALFQVNSSQGDVVKGTAFLVGYNNNSSRWNWGLLGGQVPLVTRLFNTQLAMVGSDTVQIFQFFRFFQINRQAGFVVAYPFNRSQRVELSLTARSIDFAFEVEEFGVDPFTGQVLFRDRRNLPDCSAAMPFGSARQCAPGSLNMATGSVALVYDNSIFGGTSAILGQRYRFELQPTAGSLNYLTALADVRKYVMPVRPLVLAGRVLHFGRYFDDGVDPRLNPLFLGFPSLVRGYTSNSFDTFECRFAENGNRCPVFDQLLGSRIGVANFELRLPLFGGIGVVPTSQVPPVEIGGFFDAGIAWSPIDGQRLSDRSVVKSVGGLARMNLFGLAVAELDVVNPLDRPDQSWFVQFNLQPGF